MPRQPHHSPNYGGFRAGSGRKYMPDRYSKDLVKQAHENGIHPFTYLLSIMRDDTQEPKVRMFAASSLLPYCAQRLSSTEVKVSTELDSLSLAEKIALASTMRDSILEARPDTTLPQLEVIEGEVENL